MPRQDFFSNLFGFFAAPSAEVTTMTTPTSPTTGATTSYETFSSPPSSPRSPRSPRAKIMNNVMMKSPIGSPIKFLRSHVGSPRFGKQLESKNAACSSSPKSPIKHDRFQTQLRPSPPASPVLNKWRQESAPTSTPTDLNREPEFTVTEKVLGEGAFSQVKLATNNLTGQKVAVKSFAIPAAGPAAMNASQKENYAMLKKEKDILARMPSHPNVVKMHHATENPTGMNLYLQFVEGGDAYTWLCERGRVAENVAKPLFKQMVQAIAHCHQAAGVCHRDVKLENFLLDRNLMRPVLIDFGFASPITSDGIYRDFPGSPDYACPDILMGRPYNGVSADVYALGVMLYTMLYYRYPFHSENRATMVRRVCEEEPRFDPSVRVSAACIDLLTWMLKKRGQERPSIQQILEHPFLAGC